jgi:hypothetical protein
MPEPKGSISPNRYRALIEHIFVDRHEDGIMSIEFERDDIPAMAEALGLE